MISAEKCRIHATECKVLASSVDIPAQRSLEQSIMALNWEALADQIDHEKLSRYRRGIFRIQSKISATGRLGWRPSLLAYFDPRWPGLRAPAT